MWRPSWIFISRLTYQKGISTRTGTGNVIRDKEEDGTSDLRPGSPINTILQIREALGHQSKYFKSCTIHLRGGPYCI